MNVLVILVPCSLILGLGALAAFAWTIRNNQYEDMEGDAHRILLDDARDTAPTETGSGS